MSYTELKKGDPWPFQSSRGLTGRMLDAPIWHALIVPPMGEAKAKRQLDPAGVTVAYPEAEVVRHRSGKRYEIKRPLISGVIYARFKFSPNWDVMRKRRVISGVFCNRTTPVSVPDSVVRVICDLPAAIDEAERERIAAMTPDEGEQVQLKGGLFDGFRVDVKRTEEGRVWYEAVTEIGKVSGETSVHDILRLAV